MDKYQSRLRFFCPSLSPGLDAFQWRHGLAIGYGGLRGAVGLTLALIVEEEIGQRGSEQSEMSAAILFYAVGIALLTLLVNGTTSKCS